jgi:hypothetical protein
MKLVLKMLILIFVGLGAAQASIFTETVDAGDFLNPQSVEGSGITVIQGSVGGNEDPVDAFRFWFAGGFLGLKAESWLCDFETPWSNDDPACRGDLSIGLIDMDSFEPVDPCTPDDPCHAVGLLQVNLSAGNYVVGVCFPPNPCMTDPPFTIGLLDVTGGSAEISAPVPEPATLALVLAAGLGWRLAGRRRGAGRVRSASTRAAPARAAS